MRPGSVGVYVLLALSVAACTSPTTPAGSITVTTAGPVSPANGALFANLAQPVTLTVTNAMITDSTAVVLYTFEVATDAGFANKVVTKDVPQTPGQTLLKLDLLSPGRDYYWHVRTTGADTVGTFTSALRFTIGPAIVVGAPAPNSPVSGITTAGWPTLIATNAVRSGPITSVVYRFDVSTSSAFSAITVTGTVSEGTNQTSFTIPSDITVPTLATQYFWRVTATDLGSGISGAASATFSFTVTPQTRQAKIAAQLGLTLWPGIQPPGTNGHAVLGPNWDVQTLTAFAGTKFVSPMLEWLQLFDLVDRGFDPQAAIDWMDSHGYFTVAAWYPEVAVIGVQFVYLALVDGAWELVLRAE